MDVIKLLEYLQEIVETSPKIPVTGKVAINKKEVMNVIDQIVNCLPDEFKKAQWIVDEKERILGEALSECDTIKKESLDILKRQVETHDITKDAKLRAEEIIASAQRDAKTMRLGARDYADEILCQLEDEMNTKGKDMLENIKKQVEEFLISMDDQINSSSHTIRENIKELRGTK